MLSQPPDLGMMIGHRMEHSPGGGQMALRARWVDIERYTTASRGILGNWYDETISVMFSSHLFNDDVKTAS